MAKTPINRELVWQHFQKIVDQEILAAPRITWEQVDWRLMKYLTTKGDGSPWMNHLALLLGISLCHARIDLDTASRRIGTLLTRVRESKQERRKKLMSKRKETTVAPEPLEEYSERFDDLFEKWNQREGFRRYLEGLLLPTERNKTLTGLANTEPVVGAQDRPAQFLQWFLSEADWDERKIQTQRLQLLLKDPLTAPSGHGVLVIDEHGDRKAGTHIAHVGRQYLGNLGKVDNGVVSVTSLWADEGVYYPVDFEPYTPADHFEKGRKDPSFRTKLKIALQLVTRAIQVGIPFRAVVADSFYGEDLGLRQELRALQRAYVLALKPSHGWWHAEGAPGSLKEVAQAAGWKSAQQPGQWVKVERTFRDGSKQTWWALEVQVGPYGPEKTERAVIATTDPVTLPDISTWYLVTNLPAPKSLAAEQSKLVAASIEEVIRLYGLRMWIEQSYKQRSEEHTSELQSRSDLVCRLLLEKKKNKRTKQYDEEYNIYHS